MIQKSGRKKYRIFAYDVESHNDEESIAKGETAIWLSSFIDELSTLDGDNVFFYTIESWLDYINELSKGKRKNKNENKPIKNIIIYIYNLSFEWSFILPKLLDRGFTFKQGIEKDDEMVYTSVSTRSVSSVWSASIKFGKRNGIIHFRDLAKIFPGGLRKVAKSFGLATQKGEIDYKLNRLHYRPTGEDVTAQEKEYCFKDTKILMDILVEMQKRDDKEFWKSTSAASYATSKMIKQGFSRSHRPLQAFRKIYPILKTEEAQFLRETVGGGITYAPSLYQFKDIKETIAHMDLHQAHPSSAYFKLYPYGEGEYFEGNPPVDGRIKACHIKVSYTGVRLHSVIKLIGIEMIDEFDLYVWDFEIPVMMMCYIDLKIEYIDGYAYKRRRLPWREFYRMNYEARAKAKAEHDDFNIMYYKLLNNSSYGKMLERGHNEVFENVIDENGIITSEVHPKPLDQQSDGGRYTYLGIGSCIPAYTRCTLIRAAIHIGWPYIVYFDTDSIFFIKNEHTMKRAKDLDFDDHLGGWGWEHDIVRAQFTAPKRYKLEEYTFNEEKQKYEVIPVFHLAGFNGLQGYSYEELDIIHGVYDVQRVKRVKGGTIIIESTKEIDVQPKYQSIYKANVKG